MHLANTGGRSGVGVAVRVAVASPSGDGEEVTPEAGAVAEATAVSNRSAARLALSAAVGEQAASVAKPIKATRIGKRRRADTGAQVLLPDRSNALDLNENSARQPCYFNRGARGRIFGEVGGVNVVHQRKVVDILQKHGGLHYSVQA